MEEITLSNGMNVLKSNYIKLKTKDLIDFGYLNLTEQEVAEQVEKILNNDSNLTVIGAFCEGDIKVDKGAKRK